MPTTAARFRRLALALPGAVEGAHHGNADFRLGGRVFASIHPCGTRGMVKVPLGVQQRLCERHAVACAPASGAWGRAGCTIVDLARLDAAVLRDALAEAWQFAAAGAAPRRKNKQSPS